MAAPAAEAPAETPLPVAPEAVPAAPIAPVAAEPAPAPADQLVVSDDMLPIAGAAGLGLLALAGAGVAMRRRKRRREQMEFEDRQWALDHVEAESDRAMTPIAAAPVAAVRPEPVRDEPAFVRNPATAPIHDPVDPNAPVTALPAGFDLSKYGRHVQAAYRGPTADNPSLSLKNRLRRASFFDAQERREAEATGMPVPTDTQPAAQPAAKPQKAPAWALNQGEADFMFRPAAKKPGLKPAFQN